MSLIRGNVQETVDFPKDISSLIILKIELLPPPNLLSSVGFPVSAYGTRLMLVLESETWESPLIRSPEHPLPQFPPSNLGSGPVHRRSRAAAAAEALGAETRQFRCCKELEGLSRSPEHRPRALRTFQSDTLYQAPCRYWGED